MKNSRGFTLVEVLVSMTIFSIVMVIALGALLSMSESDRKAQTLKSVINNLNFSLDTISRSLRTGQNYHCDASIGTLTAVRDCDGSSGHPPATSLAFRAVDGTTVVYKLESSNAAACGQKATAGCLMRSNDGGLTYSVITAPEVLVTTLQFYVIGAENAAIQPKVTILLSGSVQANGSGTNCQGTGSGSTCFNLETSVTQRLYDQ